MTTAPPNPDVVILGAGAAGLATAICCAESGLRVSILEREAFPRPCVGESVHPGGEALFQRLHVSKEVEQKKFLRFSGIWVGLNGELSFVPFGGASQRPWKGYQLWRSEFDRILLERALAAGASFARCQGSDVTATSRGVEITTKARKFVARVVVDATGRNNWIARQWGLKRKNFSPLLVARYGYREGDCPDRHDNPLFAIRGNGWEWIARVRPNLYQWVSVAYERPGPNSGVVPTELRELREVGRTRGADVTWRLMSECASRRHFLVGDAASVLDPSSSHGIIKALSSGILAAECIDKIFREQSPYGAIRGYCAWQREWFDRDMRRLRARFQGLRN